MFEKVNPAHPDKIMDRITGAMVDLAYSLENNPKIAIEGVIGHEKCHIIAETSVHLDYGKVCDIVHRIANDNKVEVFYHEVPQDEHLANNQKDKIRCGDNGIFKGMPVTDEQKNLTKIAHIIYDRYGTDGKYILDGDKLILCQSCADSWIYTSFPTENAIINPLGDWVGGLGTDCGSANRKLGSDMGDSVTGGGIHSKDCSKADVSVNIYAFLKAQETGKPVELSCAIGDEYIDGKPYDEIVKIAKDYIDSIGGFEKFAEWGLIR